MAIRFKRFDWSQQYWATVKTIGGGQIQARLLDTDLPKLQVAGHEVSTWNQRRNRLVELPQPIEASFVWNGRVWSLCEVVIAAPVPVFEFETGEA